MRFLALGLMALAWPMFAPAQTIERLVQSDRSGTAYAVRTLDVPLVFTGQSGARVAADDARAEAVPAPLALEQEHTAVGSDGQRVVRLNGLVAVDADVVVTEAVVAEQFAAAPIAFTLRRTAHVAVLPGGARRFNSGQAEKGAAATTQRTRAGLQRTPASVR